VVRVTATELSHTHDVYIYIYIYIYLIIVLVHLCDIAVHLYCVCELFFFCHVLDFLRHPSCIFLPPSFLPLPFSGRETRKYAGVSGFLPARRLRELSRSLRVASAYVSGEPNDRVRATMCQRERGTRDKKGRQAISIFFFIGWKFRNRTPKGSCSIKDGRREAERGMGWPGNREGYIASEGLLARLGRE